MKQTFKEFLFERSNELDDDRFKDLDCSADDLTPEQQEWCNKKYILELIKKFKIANN